MLLLLGECQLRTVTLALQDVSFLAYELATLFQVRDVLLRSFAHVIQCVLQSRGQFTALPLGLPV